MVHILIVDDDPHIRELIQLFLQKEGFQTITAETGQQALDVVERMQVDLIVLDIMMPEMDGWEFCQTFRRYYSDTLPILMLTAKGETAQKLKGFALGIDDYMVKPFVPEELVARVKVLLKRHHVSATQSIRIGNITLDRATHQVYAKEESIMLPLKEFELLFTLGANPGKTFTRESLIEKIWGFDYAGDDRTVDVHIKRIRKRFAPEEAMFKITTIRGLGYRLETMQ